VRWSNKKNNGESNATQECLSDRGVGSPSGDRAKDDDHLSNHQTVRKKNRGSWGKKAGKTGKTEIRGGKTTMEEGTLGGEKNAKLKQAPGKV